MDNTLMQALVNQMNLERQNAAIYDALSAMLNFVSWDGSAKWMKHSADDERAHADMMKDYVIARYGMPIFSDLVGCNVPTSDDLVQYFQAALDQERLTTESIKTLSFQAEDTEDPQTCAFLVWFLEEQTKAERELFDFITLLQRLDKTGWMVFDKELK